MRGFAKKIIVFALCAGFLVGAFVAYADWSEPPKSKTREKISLPAALNTGAKTQEKLGGLELNAGGADIGLVIAGNKNNGFFGIGNLPPKEKLDVIGNIGFSGMVFANGSGGDVGELITRTSPNKEGEPQMDWKKRWAWMVIQRIDIITKDGCTKIFPVCPAGWKEKEIIAISNACLKLTKKNAPPLAYGGELRICFKDF